MHRREAPGTTGWLSEPVGEDPIAARPPSSAQGTEQWPALRELSSIDALPTSSYRYLLDLDDDLAEQLDLRMRLVARQVVTAVVFAAPAGACDLSRCSRTAPGY